MKIGTSTLSLLLELADRGVINHGEVSRFNKKAGRLAKKSAKAARQADVNARVTEALENILSEAGAATQHRAVWVRVGREDHTREEVLTALQVLRTDGVLKTFKKSGNNFQVFWARVEDKPEAADFEVNADDDDDAAE
jgi:hypothetical protein